ncbi:glycosyltransferase [Streptomyces sp. NPDC007088]|uniref:glycosyltransferase n=1 Tax=Streptomyces sp. NPDC007088 TaxID=3364773 RepID=UPI0036CD3F88
MKISFLIHNAYGIGATIRGTTHLSAALAERHEVEVVSVHRVADVPALPFDPRVRVGSLIDMREGTPGYEGDHVLNTGTHRMFPDPAVEHGRLRYRTLHDLRLTEWLAWTDAEAVIATRPLLNGYLARHGSDRYLRIGQEHRFLDAYGERLRADQNSAIGSLDAFVTLTEADARAYRAALPSAADRVHAVPHGVPATAAHESTRESRTVVAAGRLVPGKRYDRLIDAFAKVSGERPGWTLRIYGRGPEHGALRRRIDSLGLYDRVFLMGAVTSMETEWAKAAVAAVSSDEEPFGLGIVEAMRCAVPVLATDCPHGPATIIEHDRNGLLVPRAGGTDAFAQALASLMDDRALRHRLGRAAVPRAAQFDPAVAAGRYEEIFRSVQERRARERAELDALTPGRGRAARAVAAPREPAAARRPRLRPRRGAAGTGATPAVPRPAGPPAARARIVFDGALEISLDPDTVPAGPLDFLARLRHDPEGRELRLRLPGEGEPRVVLERRANRLAEGRWDTYLIRRDTGKRRRLRALLVEQAALLELEPVVDAEGLSSWVPYRTADGYLAVRAWQRPAHAEIRAVESGESGLLVSARLYGAARLPAEGATVRAQARDPRTESFTLTARDHGGGSFSFSFPYVVPLTGRRAAEDVWDFSLLPEPDSAPIPVGRVLGDIVDRKRTDILPQTLLSHPERDTTTRVRPFFNVKGDLSLLLRDRTPAAADTVPLD